MNAKPIKRNEALKTFSRDHHHGLLLCWKIRAGIKRNVSLQRIKDYTTWFWQSHLHHHFKEEELYLFTLLPPQDPLVVQAKGEHAILKNIIENEHYDQASLEQLQELLQNHIRFEERYLFNKIQETATAAQLQAILDLPHQAFCDNWKDEFWIS